MGKKKLIWKHYNNSGAPMPSFARYHECPNCGEVFDAPWPMGREWQYCPLCGSRVELDERMEADG